MAIYNEQAIRFYVKNEFIRMKGLKEWYNIFEKPYDAVLLYKKIDNDLLVIESELKL